MIFLRTFLILLLIGGQVSAQNKLGWIPDPETTELVAARTEHNRIPIIALQSLKMGDEDALNWRPLRTALQKANQLTAEEQSSGRLNSLNQKNEGSCTGYAAAIALDTLIANQAANRNLRLQFKYRSNPDTLYGISRQTSKQLGMWQGSTGAWIVDGMRDIGFLYRMQYQGHDLRETSPQKAAQYRSRGVPQDLLSQIIHKADAVRINNADEAKAALQGKLSIILCAQASYPKVRDSQGFAKRSGRAWSHAMGVIAYRGVKSGREGFLVQNSWGNTWNSGPIWPNDMPHGSFWITRADLEYHIQQEDCWIFTKADGFEKQFMKGEEVFEFKGRLVR